MLAFLQAPAASLCNASPVRLFLWKASTLSIYGRGARLLQIKIHSKIDFSCISQAR